MRIFFILLFCFLTLVAEEDSYELGEGVQIANFPLYLGGYSSLQYQNRKDIENYSIDDLALLGYGSYDKFSYMIELEYKRLYVKTYTNSGKFTTKDTRLHTERLYVDYNYDQNFMVRVGKYNSPIGYWNLLPINVLRETTSNPQSTLIVFPKLTTGADLSYSSYKEGEIKFDLLIQRNEDIDDEYNNYRHDRHYGLGVSFEKDCYSFKINTGYFRQVETSLVNNDRYYVMLSGKYESEKIQVMGELGYQKANHITTTPYAGYLQTAYRFTEQHIGTLRLEAFKDNVAKTNDEVSIFAYTYRPSYPIAIKSEYQLHSLHNEDQFLFSLSVLF